MDKEKLLGLAKLARIGMSDEEAENLSHEFEAILAYVSDVKQITSTKHQILNKSEAPKPEIRNVFREDGEPHESGVYTEKILEQAPAREGNYIKVKKIL